MSLPTLQIALPQSFFNIYARNAPGPLQFALVRPPRSILATSTCIYCLLASLVVCEFDYSLCPPFAAPFKLWFTLEQKSSTGTAKYPLFYFLIVVRQSTGQIALLQLYLAQQLSVLLALCNLFTPTCHVVFWHFHFKILSKSATFQLPKRAAFHS